MRRSILVVAPYLPWPADFGGALRILHLVRVLARDHDVILVAPARRDEREGLLQLGEICDVTAVPVEWTPRQPAGPHKRLTQLRALAGPQSFLARATWIPQFQTVLDRLFMTRRIDVVQYELTQLALYRPARPTPTVIDAFDIQYDLLDRVARATSSELQRVFNLIEARKVKALERRLWRQATVCVTSSERDAALIRGQAETPTVVVPNGVDTTAFHDVDTSARRPDHVVFTGAMRHHPNADGARWYAAEIHPFVLRAIPTATVSFVGADPPARVRELASRSITVTGHVDDVRPYLAEAGVAVVPLRSGGGTRLKILEAFAAGVPVVSTSVGAEGLGVEDGVNILIADEPAEFAAAVVRLLRNRAFAGRIVEAGRRTARERYDWAIIAPKLVAAHDLAINHFSIS